MVQNCRVPLCTKRTYREDGMKIYFNKFPSDKCSRDEWIRAVRSSGVQKGGQRERRPPVSISGGIQSKSEIKIKFFLKFEIIAVNFVVQAALQSHKLV